MKVQLDDGAYMPIKAHEADAGYDLMSPVDTYIYPDCDCIINTGVHFQIPEGYVGFIKSRSSMNVKHGIICEGVIDSGYTGSVVVKLHSLGSEGHRIDKGDKIAQIVFLPVFMPVLHQVDSLDESERGSNGFGSTGR